MSENKTPESDIDGDEDDIKGLRKRLETISTISSKDLDDLFDDVLQEKVCRKYYQVPQTCQKFSSVRKVCKLSQ